MAKDGTNRGGIRIGSGRKKKSLDERLLEGSEYKAHIMENVPDFDDLEGADVPSVSEYLTRTQKDGSQLIAKDVFRDTWLWLKKRGCETLVSKQLIEQYALAVARWIHCEETISQYGYLSKHPTTKEPIASPFIAMSKDYKKQMNADWYLIWQVVKENSSVRYGENPNDDKMDKLLEMKLRK